MFQINNSDCYINLKMDVENVSTHKITLDHYQFDLTYEEPNLYFDITCSKTFAKYRASINSDSIKNNKNIEFFFSTPQDLFHFFTGGSTNNLQLKNGVIVFNIETKLGKAVKTYQCLIETVKEDLQPETVLKLKFQRLEQQVENLKTQNGKLKQKIAQQDLEVSQIRQEVDKCQKELAKKDEVISAIFKDLKEFDQWRRKRESQVVLVNSQVRKFEADQTNPHNKKFTEIGGNRYRKNVGASWDVLMSKNAIEKNQVSRYHIKQVRAGSNGSFMYGIGTEAVKGMNRAQDSKEYIGYYENTGFIYDQTESKKGGPKIKDGEVITIEVDTKKWKISWIIEGKKEAQANIANQLRVKPIYLAIVVFNQDSEIEFL